MDMFLENHVILGKLYPTKFFQFIFGISKKITSFRKNYDIDDNDLGRLINCDEVPIYTEMVTNKTVQIKGAEDIEVATFGGEKVRISWLLSCVANGTKLPPILVFKATKGGNLEKSLNTLPIV